MFLIASTGRCGTDGLCAALDRHTDHDVVHERPPQLLREAWAKHHGHEFRTPRLAERLADYAARRSTPYGESIRTPNLLDEVLGVAPDCRILVLVRDPTAYARSAYAKGATRSNGEWDQYRLTPHDLGSSPADPAAVLLGNWRLVNQLLLDLAETYPAQVAVTCMRPWESIMGEVAGHLGVSITDEARMSDVLGARLNRTKDERAAAQLTISEEAAAPCVGLWERAQSMDAWPQ